MTAAVHYFQCSNSCNLW